MKYCLKQKFKPPFPLSTEDLFQDMPSYPPRHGEGVLHIPRATSE